MGMSKATVVLAIAAACFLPGNASAFGGTFLLDRDRVHVSAISSHTEYNFLPPIWNLSGHGANAAPNKSIEAGLPCPSGHPWQAADSSQEAGTSKVGKAERDLDGPQQDGFDKQDIEERHGQKHHFRRRQESPGQYQGAGSCGQGRDGRASP
jgi:hypothetical protein